MMKLLFLSTGLDAGGAQMMLYNLLSKLDRRRFDPIVVSLMDRDAFGDRIEALGIPVHTLNMQAGKPTLAAIWQLFQTTNQLKPDLIQGWMYHGNLAAQLMSSIYRFPVVWSVHYSLDALASDKKLTVALIKLGAYLSQLPKQVLFVSRISKSQHEALGYARENSNVIPNGFDIVRYVPSENDRRCVRTELNLPEDCLLIGIAGRYHPMKDHANFVRAAAMLSKTTPHVRFLMIGQDLTPDNPALNQLIQELGVHDRIFCLGERQDMPRLLASLDIFTSASAYGEAFPMVIGEAMACGAPCVVTDVGDSSLIVGDTGKVIPPQNSQALATAWNDLIHLDVEDRCRLGKAARSRIVDQFSLDAIVTQYEHLYTQILNQP